MTIGIRRIRALAAVVATALTVACFEQPITESIAIRFLPPDAAMIRVTVRLADPKEFKESPAARDRIEAARRAIVDLRDPWSDRIARLAPEEERITWDRSRGEVARFDHRALITQTDRLHSFFRDTLVQAGVTHRENAMEFALTPRPGSRAGRPEQERFDRALEEWAVAVVDYLRDGRRLYDYLDDNPDRARACFAGLFKDLLPDEVRDAAGNLTDRDEEALDPFSDSMTGLLAVLSVQSGEAYSVEELSALVLDPFPAPLTVQVAGPVLEVGGFETGPGGVLRVPTRSLWSAFTRLETRWITPNPAVVLYRHLGQERQPLDLDAFLAQPRSATAPAGPSEVIKALMEEMRTAPIYRVRWSTADLKEPEPRGDLWDLPELQ